MSCEVCWCQQEGASSDGCLEPASPRGCGDELRLEPLERSSRCRGLSARLQRQAQTPTPQKSYRSSSCTAAPERPPRQRKVRGMEKWIYILVLRLLCVPQRSKAWKHKWKLVLELLRWRYKNEEVVIQGPYFDLRRVRLSRVKLPVWLQPTWRPEDFFQEALQLQRDQITQVESF